MVYIDIIRRGDTPGTYFLILLNIFIGAPVFIMVFVMIYNWRRSSSKIQTFNELVKIDLDEFYRLINPHFKGDGIQWGTIDGHYWIECRIIEKVHNPSNLNQKA